MAGVDGVDELGRVGPLIASAVNPENADNPELRRYEAKLGRDAFYAAEFLSEQYPQLEDGTVRYFASYQASGTDDRRQSSRGKIPNHVRAPDDPLAIRLTHETGRRWPWYGGTDTTVQFLSAVCRFLTRHPDRWDEKLRYPADHGRAGRIVYWGEEARTVGKAALDAGRWLLNELNSGPETGLLWVPMNRKDSFTVWTDSPNAFHFRDGILARPPIAPVQLQAQAYDALRDLATVLESIPALQATPQTLSPDHLIGEAERVRRRLIEHFVVEDDRGMFFGNGVAYESGVLRVMDVRTINMGFLLDSTILEEVDAAQFRSAVTRQLFAPEMLSPFGIIGRARDEVRFEKFDYHAQVWGFAVHKVANGLRRCGYRRLGQELDRRVIRQARDGLMPENVGAASTAPLEYCPHVLTVARLAANGQPTLTVKERPPAPYAAWTAAAFLEIQASADKLSPSGLASHAAFEKELLARLDQWED